MIRIKHEGSAHSKVIVINWGSLMISPLTELTQLSSDIIRSHGTTFERAVAMVRSEMTPETVIVGMNMKRHVQALHLCRNVHYESYVDLTSLLKVRHGRRWHFLPLDTIATVLGFDQSGHYPIDDLAMVQYVNMQCQTEHQISLAIDQLRVNLITRAKSSANHIYSIDGVCTSAYNERHCSCQQMTLKPQSNHPMKAHAARI
jgi:hypothetical protein